MAYSCTSSISAQSHDDAQRFRFLAAAVAALLLSQQPIDRLSAEGGWASHDDEALTAGQEDRQACKRGVNVVLLYARFVLVFETERGEERSEAEREKTRRGPGRASDSTGYTGGAGHGTNQPERRLSTCHRPLHAGPALNDLVLGAGYQLLVTPAENGAEMAVIQASLYTRAQGVYL